MHKFWYCMTKICVNSSRNPLLMFPGKHSASRNKEKKKSNLCLLYTMCFYILRYLTLHRLSEVKNILLKSIHFTYLDKYQLQQCKFSCKLRKLLAISEEKKAVLRKEFSSVFSVYIVIFLSIFLY